MELTRIQLWGFALVQNETCLEQWRPYTAVQGYRQSSRLSNSCRASASACSTSGVGVCFLGLGRAQPDWRYKCARNGFVKVILTQKTPESLRTRPLCLVELACAVESSIGGPEAVASWFGAIDHDGYASPWAPAATTATERNSCNTSYQDLDFNLL